MDYITIEDIWRNLSVKIRHLKELIDVTTSFPMDKYKLYVHIATAFIKKPGCVFNLEQFAFALGISAEFSNDSITPYERLIAELLSKIDDEQLRSHSIRLLDANTSHSWREYQYGGQFKENL